MPGDIKWFSRGGVGVGVGGGVGSSSSGRRRRRRRRRGDSKEEEEEEEEDSTNQRDRHCCFPVGSRIGDRWRFLTLPASASATAQPLPPGNHDGGGYTELGRADVLLASLLVHRGWRSTLQLRRQGSVARAMGCVARSGFLGFRECLLLVWSLARGCRSQRDSVCITEPQIGERVTPAVLESLLNSRVVSPPVVRRLHLGGGCLSEECFSHLPTLLSLHRGSLTTIDISGNEGSSAAIGGLLQAARSWPALSTLNISHNCAGAWGVNALARLLAAAALPSLTHLDAGHNDDGRGCETAAFAAFAAALGAARPGGGARLRVLSMEAMGGGPRSIEELARSLGHGACPMLEELHIAQNACGVPGMKALGAAIFCRQLPRLAVLDVSFNAAGPVGLSALAAALQPHSTPTPGELGDEYVQEWDSERQQYRYRGTGLTDWKAAGAVAPSCANLTALSAAGNRGGEVGIAALAQCLRKGGLPGIRFIRLGGNGAAETGMSAIADALSHGRNPVLRGAKHVDLSGNAAGPEGTSALAKSLISFHAGTGAWLDPSRRQSLQFLSVAVNRAGPVGVCAIASALRAGALASLTHLDLSANGCAEEGLVALGGALAATRCPSLRHLGLAKNNGGRLGVEAVARSLASGACRSLAVLMLSQNRAGPEGAVAVASALSQNACAALRELDLASNGIGAMGFQAIASMLQSGACGSLRVLRVGPSVDAAGRVALGHACHSRRRRRRWRPSSAFRPPIAPLEVDVAAEVDVSAASLRPSSAPPSVAPSAHSRLRTGGTHYPGWRGGACVIGGSILPRGKPLLAPLRELPAASSGRRRPQSAKSRMQRSALRHEIMAGENWRRQYQVRQRQRPQSAHHHSSSRRPKTANRSRARPQSAK